MSAGPVGLQGPIEYLPVGYVVDAAPHLRIGIGRGKRMPHGLKGFQVRLGIANVGHLVHGHLQVLREPFQPRPLGNPRRHHVNRHSGRKHAEIRHMIFYKLLGARTKIKDVLRIRRHDARLGPLRMVERQVGARHAVSDKPVPHLLQLGLNRIRQRGIPGRLGRDGIEPADTQSTFRDRLLEDLTEKQFDALQTALYGGFYEWPRTSTREELAATRDIASSTFSHHLRAAERKVLSAVLDSV